ncbi:hypothetical protein [Polluticaenibacter yanchengensis]|uniref:Molecular chaperone n=1 Tax=Polluticaenibacter yanchengensis TaxID=3014562 RepID=A0ABT4ULV8_9BACT|nr:hypothetical protein [Chitinophagaceae bacterium LY-5]
MKKIIMFLSCILCYATIINAQNVTFISGAKFTAIDDVTIEVDVTNTGMAGEPAAYLWIWSNPDLSNSNYPGKESIYNTSWGNSPENAKLTMVSANKFRFTFKAVDIFLQTPGQLFSFGFLLKTKNGSKKTDDFKPFEFVPLVFKESVFRVFPESSGINDVITINYNKSFAIQTNALSVNEQRMTVTSASVELLSSTGAVMATLSNLPVRMIKDGVYAATFIVKQFPNLPSNLSNAKYIRYKFHGTAVDNTGATVNVITQSAQYEFSNLK